MIAQELEVSLHMAFVEARQKRHEFITVEHLLLALLDNTSAAETLRACGGNIEPVSYTHLDVYKRQTWQTRAMIVAPVVLGMKVGDSSSKQGLASSQLCDEICERPIACLLYTSRCV